MRYQIETEFQGAGFVAVPNWVAQDARLSPEAVGVLVYLASLPNGWRLSPDDVRARFGMGKDRWQRIARELRAAGAMMREAIRGAGGRLLGEVVRVRWPEAGEADAVTEKAETTGSRKTRHPVAKHRKPENPAAGKPAKQSRETRQKEPENPAPYKEQTKKTGRDGEAAQPEPNAVREKRGQAQPTEAPASRNAASHVERLSAFERFRVREGKAVVIAGKLVKPETPDHAGLMAALHSLERCAA